MLSCAPQVPSSTMKMHSGVCSLIRLFKVRVAPLATQARPPTAPVAKCLSSVSASSEHSSKNRSHPEGNIESSMNIARFDVPTIETTLLNWKQHVWTDFYLEIDVSRAQLDNKDEVMSKLSAFHPWRICSSCFKKWTKMILTSSLQCSPNVSNRIRT